MKNKFVMLIVDDMEINRKILQSIFKEDFEIVEAENGLVALEIIRRWKKIDIILLDIVMPEMNGIEFLKIIKVDEQFAKIPVIVNTQQGEIENEIITLDLGVDDFIIKPYNSQIVKRRINNLVQKTIMERQQMENQLQHSRKELRYRAERDWLTGIYNRETFCKKVRELLERNPKETYVIGQYNIDRFKVINELFGSNMGDTVLVELAHNLKIQIKDNGIFGRLEGDRFVTCIPKAILDKNLDSFVESLTNNIEKNIHTEYPLMVHVGFYEIDQIDISVDLMCDRAGLAVQTIKGNYLQRWAYYNQDLSDVLLDEQELIREMESALKERQFFIQLQPIYQVNTGKIESAEALVRWNNPIKGMIVPGQFIPLFERNGFITKLDMFVWEEVCKILSENQQQGKRNVPISVNVSRINFHSSDFCFRLLKLIEKYEIDVSLLKLEITESAYTNNPLQLISIIKDCQRYGFEVLMDDFGSGYSSLNMLKDVPVDILKIDMQFIDNLEDSERACEILFHIVRMAKSLKMRVVVEGVETKNQLDLLTNMGCDSIQGYYFSKPLLKECFYKTLNQEELEDVSSSLIKKKQTILVVDIVKTSHITLWEGLEDSYKLVKLQNEKEAFAFLKKNFGSIHLIIMHVVIPVSVGFSLLESIVGHEELNTIPMLVISENMDVENQRKVLQFGAIDVISTQVDPIIFKMRIENLLMVTREKDSQMEMHMLRERIVEENTSSL